jgi:hypothetical protein
MKNFYQNTAKLRLLPIVISFLLITISAFSQNPWQNIGNSNGKTNGFADGPARVIPDAASQVNTGNTDAPGGSISVNENSTYNGYTPAQLVQNILVTGCLKASNVSFTGVFNTTDPTKRQLGYFNRNNTSFALDEGLIMSSGYVTEAMGPNNSTQAGSNLNGAGDADLTSIAGYATHDAAVLQFDFVPAGNKVEFQYVFASEEYLEYCCTQYNDAFGFFLSGPGITGPYSGNSTNIALIPGTNTPVAINNIHSYVANNANGNSCAAVNASYYVNNPPNSLITQYDGLTVTLTAIYDVVPCQTYHIKLKVADVSDGLYSSAVFLKAKSFNSEPVTLTNINPSYGNTDFANIFEGCSPNHLIIDRTGSDLSQAQIVQMQYAGTATNGVDVKLLDGSPLPSEITIPAGQTSYSMDYYAVADGISDNGEVLNIETLQSCPCDPNAVYIMKEIHIYETTLSITATPTNILCNGNSAGVITVSVNGGSGTYQYSLDNTTWQNSNLFTGLSQGTYTVYVKDIGSCFPSASLGNIVLGPPTVIQANAGPDVTICSGTSTQLNGSGGVNYSWNPRIGLNSYTVPNPIATPSETTTYTLTVTDANSICTSTDQVVITVIPSPTISVSPINAEICAGTSQTLIASGGVSYLWNPTGETTAAISVTPISNSSYTVIGTAANGCTGTATVPVVVKPVPQNVNAGSNASIGLCQTYQLQGSATSGNGASITYQWSPSTGLSDANIANPVFTPTESGTFAFTLTVTGNNGCSASDEVTITIDPLLTSSISNQVNVNCFEGSTGSATVLANGGTLPYTYSWDTNPVQSTASATGLLAGTYTVTVNDANNCTSSSQVTISQPSSAITFNSPVVAMVSCTGSSDGQIVISASGGTGTISFSISPNDGTQSPSGTFNGLTSQTYTITAEDENGCTNTINVLVGTVTDNIPPTISCPANVNALTNNACTAINVDLGEPYFSDNCGVASIVNNAPEFYMVGNTVITWTVTDNSGNTATCDQVVTVRDSTVPFIICPADLNLTVDLNCMATGHYLGFPLVDDNCYVATVTNDAPSAFPLGATTVTWIVTDNSVNTAI